MWSRKTGAVCGVISFLTGALSVVLLIELDDLFRHILHKQLPLIEGSPTFKVWKDVGSGFDTCTKFYFFNVTNPEGVLRGAKPQVQEVGPYTYRTEWVRENITFNSNGTMSFLQKMLFFYDDESSVGSEDDLVTTVNVPYVSTASLLRKQFFPIPSLAKMALSSLGHTLLVRKSVGQLTFEGYPDILIMLASAAGMGPNDADAGGVDISRVFKTGYRTLIDKLKEQPKDMAGKFAYMAGRNDTFHDVYTMFTGEDDISRINQVDRVSGRTHFDIWDGDECNKIHGTFGNVRPPMSSSDSQTIFIPDIKRSFNLHRVGESKVKSLSTQRFAATSSVFANADDVPENACYTKTSLKLPSGLSDLGPVLKGAPIAMSLPHFLYGNESLVNGVEGLSPNESQHMFYVDSEPTTGASLSARARLQMNVFYPSPGVWSSSESELTVLPLFWQETSAEAKDHMVSTLRLAVLAPTLGRCAAIFVIVTSSLLVISSLYCFTMAGRSRCRVVSSVNVKKQPRDKESVLLNGGAFLVDNNNAKNGLVPEEDRLLQQSVV